MNKIKLFLMTTAVFAAIGGAFATKRCFDCENSQQYMFNGMGYVATGVFGVNYFCAGSAGTCTYTFEGTGYSPCRKGSYTPL
jgi:hypothetical protein